MELGTEFGRTPRINVDNGRDRHKEAIACQVVGEESGVGRRMGRPRGGEVEDGAVNNPAWSERSILDHKTSYFK